MQLDMHYYGTYAMARAAGLNKDTIKIHGRSLRYRSFCCYGVLSPWEPTAFPEKFGEG